MEEMNLDITSEFLVMASTLLYLKSKSLLPKQENEEEELTEEELIRRIIEYKKYKEITNKLKENFQIFSNRLFKVAEEIQLPKQKLERNYDENKVKCNLKAKTKDKMNKLKNKAKGKENRKEESRRRKNRDFVQKVPNKNSEIEAKARVALAQKESQKELANGVKEVMGKETEEKEI